MEGGFGRQIVSFFFVLVLILKFIIRIFQFQNIYRKYFPTREFDFGGWSGFSRAIIYCAMLFSVM